MTEVADMTVPDHRVATVRHYEAGPPPGLELVEPGETVATTKEEEWVSKKKTEIKNTRQIETRVKRQVVLEDGKVVEDSGPMVTTNTTEDTETHEHHQTELRKLGDDETDQKALEEGATPDDDKSKWVSVPNPDGVVREVKERRVISREETEEHKETEDVQHFGDITDEEFLAAVNSGHTDLRQVLRKKEGDRTVVSTGPRVIHESSRSNKVTDTEDTRELSSVLPDGRIVTETQRTTEHEELKDDDLPEGEPDKDEHKESSQRYLKTRDQEDVDYIANGVNVGHEMRYRADNTEMDRRGDGFDELEWDSLSARARRRSNNTRPPQKYRGVEPTQTLLDRKDALTKRPLDFDVEEETRKQETSKWLEHHFGSESRSSNNSIDGLDEESPPKTSFFNVTIKSQPARIEPSPPRNNYVTNINGGGRVYSPVEPERERSAHQGGYFQGISEWSERRRESRETYTPERRSPPNYRDRYSPIERIHDRSPVPDYRIHRETRASPSPIRDTTPTPPQRKRGVERRQRISQDSRYDSGYRTPSRNDTREEPLEEPPPDYSPPSPPPMPVEKKQQQKTRFAADPPKAKSGNIIGQSIRKLVGKIRSASAERKAKQRAKRSPSPSYQKGHEIDGNINGNGNMEKSRRGASPVHRYYLGEDPFGGSIYGRENKYDGVKPARSSRRQHQQRENREEENNRSQSTLGRFSKSTGRLASRPIEDQRSSQTLPRHLSRHEPPTREDNTINVSIINTVSSPPTRPLVNGGPAKPARTYKSNLSRSKSFNVHADPEGHRSGMYKSNPQLHRLDENPIGLKSPALISSLSRSQRDLSEREDGGYTHRFGSRNGYSEDRGRNGYEQSNDSKKVFLKSLKDRAPELFKTLHESEEDTWRVPAAYSTPAKPPRNGYDVYEPPTRLRDTTPTTHVIRRGSNSSNDYSESYHTQSRNDDPIRPSVTDTYQSFSKKTLPSRDGRSTQTIESSETKSVTKSRYRGEPITSNYKYYERENRYNSGASPVVIEVRNNYRK